MNKVEKADSNVIKVKEHEVVKYRPCIEQAAYSC